ncbi:MAG: EF-hand domain-containing protein [Desulfobaccales bacterium]
MKMIGGGVALALGLAVLVMSGCASTQEQKAQMDNQELCAVLDTNHDGKITKEAFMARATDKNQALEVFQKCDTGNKGYLTYDELINRRYMIPPEIYMTPPPIVVPRR